MADSLYALAEEYDALEADDERDEIDTERMNAIAELASDLGFQGIRAASEDVGDFILESEFEDYARQLAEDIGAISSEGGWPIDYIDWERATDALRMDYSTVEFDGDTYYWRA